MNAQGVIVDANLAFRYLRAGSEESRRRLSPDSGLHFHCPRYLFIELFKHKERLMRATGLTEADFLEGLYALVSRLDFVKESNIPVGTWVEAYRICKAVDEKDTPSVALTLHLDGRLWSGDEEWKAQLQSEGFDRFFRP